ncbi:MAG: Translation initiation factor 2 subunit beta [Candidatus Heimdallarchaeota archaeon LC_3]|nr:MAG: Translation initiation factor 2 subunit beta [Candidatus Heimdallarchaeota archaeon LC_3]
MEKDQYLTLLARARKQLPKEVFEKSRFVIPKITSFVEGNKTYITNWKDVTKRIRRDEHFIKLMAREFATSISEEGGRLIFQGKFTGSSINKQLSTYVKMYVICPECNKPDTKLVKDDRLLILVCEACGARHSVK